MVIGYMPHNCPRTENNVAKMHIFVTVSEGNTSANLNRQFNSHMSWRWEIKAFLSRSYSVDTWRFPTKVNFVPKDKVKFSSLFF